MTINELIKALQRLKVETASIACLGCGHEHNCGIHGCAIIREAVEHISSIQSAFSDGPYGFSHLLDLLRAEKEGRVMVLPCKVGDTVYMISWRLNGRHEIEERVFSLTYFDPAKYGKDYFLTREEAEKALEANGK